MLHKFPPLGRSIFHSPPQNRSCSTHAVPYIKVKSQFSLPNSSIFKIRISARERNRFYTCREEKEYIWAVIIVVLTKHQKIKIQNLRILFSLYIIYVPWILTAQFLLRFFFQTHSVLASNHRDPYHHPLSPPPPAAFCFGHRGGGGRLNQVRERLGQRPSKVRRNKRLKEFIVY